MDLYIFKRLCNRYNSAALSITSKYTGYDKKDDLYNVGAVFGGYLNGDEFVITLKTNIKNGNFRYGLVLGRVWLNEFESSFKMNENELEKFLSDGLNCLKCFMNANSTGGGGYIEVMGDL